MKNLNLTIGIILILGTMIGCEKELNNNIDLVCGVENPTENIDWIKELVAKAETDTTGNYFGSIYLEQYLGDDIIFVQMPMGSGGIYGYWYNCDGTQIVFEDTTIFPKRDKLIYSIIEGNQNEFETQ